MSDAEWLLCTTEGQRYEHKYFAEARIHVREPNARTGHHRETGLAYVKLDQGWILVPPEFHDSPAFKELCEVPPDEQ